MSKILSIQLDRDELNEKLGGGIPDASLMLIEGNDGGGKSIIAQRIAYGLIKNGSTVTYISSELHTMGFVDQMASVEYDVTEAILHETMLFIPMFPYLGNVKLRDDFMSRLMGTKKLFDNDVIIIDTLSYILIQDSVSKERIFEIIRFFKSLLSLNKTIIFCVDPDHITQEFLRMMRAVADIYVTSEAREVLGNLLRVASVKRFRRSKNAVAIQFPFKVEPRIGMNIELSSLS